MGLELTSNNSSISAILASLFALEFSLQIYIYIYRAHWFTRNAQMIFSLNFERYLISVMQAVFVISFHRILIWSYLVYLFSDIWIWKRDKVLTMNICTYSIIYTIISTTQTTSQARRSTSASPLKHAVVPGSRKPGLRGWYTTISNKDFNFRLCFSHRIPILLF
jgi:hypothetical protein